MREEDLLNHLMKALKSSLIDQLQMKTPLPPPQEKGSPPLATKTLAALRDLSQVSWGFDTQLMTAEEWLLAVPCIFSSLNNIGG